MHDGIVQQYLKKGTVTHYVTYVTHLFVLPSIAVVEISQHFHRCNALGELGEFQERWEC
jgi:hypothetical protein